MGIDVGEAVEEGEVADEQRPSLFFSDA